MPTRIGSHPDRLRARLHHLSVLRGAVAVSFVGLGDPDESFRAEPPTDWHPRELGLGISSGFGACLSSSFPSLPTSWSQRSLASTRAPGAIGSADHDAGARQDSRPGSTAQSSASSSARSHVPAPRAAGRRAHVLGHFGVPRIPPQVPTGLAKSHATRCGTWASTTNSLPARFAFAYFRSAIGFGTGCRRCFTRPLRGDAGNRIRSWQPRSYFAFRAVFARWRTKQAPGCKGRSSRRRSPTCDLRSHAFQLGPKRMTLRRG